MSELDKPGCSGGGYRGAVGGAAQLVNLQRKKEEASREGTAQSHIDVHEIRDGQALTDSNAATIVSLAFDPIPGACSVKGRVLLFLRGESSLRQIAKFASLCRQWRTALGAYVLVITTSQLKMW